ncbi:low affinity iron permease family protein [Pseudoxanthomonas sp.]|uniref:low affinity iron permease family protein n=1 Tax=Pseudoxanthomonas sp. TaxID=1871049 RepID=UPI002585BEB4|nr:low affinity iron permease family protein [Pseudoxanthomonas sp.]MCR6686390.1 low affinity iron permease family protein [Pseudoxanthomonas sp.]
MGIRDLFNTIAKKASKAAGTPWVFCLALGLILAWALSGPLFGFNDTWQLVINTSTTIITFLMVFLIQHTQNADTAALHLKLDELIRVLRDADNILLDMEEMDDQKLEELRQRYEALAEKARNGSGGRSSGPASGDEIERCPARDD